MEKPPHTCASLLKTGLKNQQNQENMDQKHSYEGYIVHKTATDISDTIEENNLDSTEDVTSNNNRKRNKRPLVHRLWKYLKLTWTGVTGTEPVIEELELPHRYRPENLDLLCEATGFTEDQMKKIYRGFKTDCPTGLITEEAFQGIYSKFFPHGAPFTWIDPYGTKRSSLRPNLKLTKKEKRELLLQQTNINSYSHYIFTTLDQEENGIITFEDFVLGLSILVKGTLDEKLRWMFALYDQDKDGYISRDEMEQVVASVFDLMGKTSDPHLEDQLVRNRVDEMFTKMDLNRDGYVSMDEFMEVCLEDESYCQSISVFVNVDI